MHVVNVTERAIGCLAPARKAFMRKIISTGFVLLILAVSIAGSPATQPHENLYLPMPIPNRGPLKDAELERSGPASMPAEKKDHSVVFILSDAGSMLSNFAEAKVDLRTGVAHLRDDQTFNIITYCDEDAHAAWPKLMPATAEQKIIAMEFVDKQVSTGTSTPFPGIKAALALNPDVIWIVSNGYTADTSELRGMLSMIERASPATRVNTLLKYTGEDSEAQRLLYAIARHGAGVCLGKDGKPLTIAPKGAPSPEVQRKAPPQQDLSGRPNIFQEN